MKAKLCRWIMRLFGWRYVGDVPSVKKAVIIAAPHTSNWDFVWAKMAFISLRIETTILMKKEMFVFPLKYLLKAWGVFPVDRSTPGSLTNQLAKEFAKRESLYLTLSPEGSRSLRSPWKKGFYYIALKAKVPVYMGKINYADKTMSCNAFFYPSGDIDKDMQIIKEHYRNCKPKYPQMFSNEV